jgi:hypothetical protein
MMLLWVGFGVVVALLGAPRPCGAVELIAHALAGVIVLPPVGACLGLVGARPRDALIVGLIGLVAGLVLGFAVEGLSLGYAAAMGLIMGGVMGATFVAFSRVSLLALRFLLGRHKT